METATKDGKDALSLNTGVVEKLLVKFLHDQVTNAGFSRVVLGLSGGVDSALVATLAVKAVGKKNVLAVILPTRSSSPASVRDAEALTGRLGIRSETIDISSMVDACIDGNKVKDRVRIGNIIARTRMIVLYDISAREKALVVGTSNKTELMLGYGTLHGDMASALNPLGDLYKTQVWQLAEAVGVPEEIRRKQPSADLWKGQTDEGELGFKYRDADALLHAMIDERRTDRELLKRGFKKEFISRIKETVRKNQFKRRPPLIAKISHRTVNVDFRYVRDWGI